MCDNLYHSWPVFQWPALGQVGGLYSLTLEEIHAQDVSGLVAYTNVIFEQHYEKKYPTAMLAEWKKHSLCKFKFLHVLLRHFSRNAL